ncbi:MAG: hypothetical protein LLF97_13200 [Planctomycetaceae bacterium]|nr:hypothetical protein [Planctomycetaceae bacterium]
MSIDDPAAAILAERTIAKAIQPTSVVAVVFNTALLLRLTDVVAGDHAARWTSRTPSSKNQFLKIRG